MYKYVGPKNLLEIVKPEHQGQVIKSKSDIENWIQNSAQTPNNIQEVIATFVIDSRISLRIADRHSEHVVCAGGEDVLSAGEMTFELENGIVKQISYITNQSTGYCPDTSSWKYVEMALEKFDLPYPSFFTQEFVFRICKNCGTINIIKDDYFVCMVCENDLLD